MKKSEVDKIIEAMAKAGYERYFDDKWDDLPVNAIEQALWRETVKAMLVSLKFPTRLYQVCLHLANRRPNEKK